MYEGLNGDIIRIYHRGIIGGDGDIIGYNWGIMCFFSNGIAPTWYDTWLCLKLVNSQETNLVIWIVGYKNYNGIRAKSHIHGNVTSCQDLLLDTIGLNIRSTYHKCL